MSSVNSEDSQSRPVTPTKNQGKMRKNIAISIQKTLSNLGGMSMANYKQKSKSVFPGGKSGVKQPPKEFVLDSNRSSLNVPKQDDNDSDNSQKSRKRNTESKKKLQLMLDLSDSKNFNINSAGLPKDKASMFQGNSKLKRVGTQRGKGMLKQLDNSGIKGSLLQQMKVLQGTFKLDKTQQLKDIKEIEMLTMAGELDDEQMSQLAMSNNKMRNTIQNSFVKMIEKHTKKESRPSSAENVRDSKNLHIDKEKQNQKTENSAHTMSQDTIGSYDSEDYDAFDKIKENGPFTDIYFQDNKKKIRIYKPKVKFQSQAIKMEELHHIENQIESMNVIPDFGFSVFHFEQLGYGRKWKALSEYVSRNTKFERLYNYIEYQKMWDHNLKLLEIYKQNTKKKEQQQQQRDLGHFSTHDKKEMEKLQKKMQKELIKKNKMTKKTVLMYEKLEDIKKGMAMEDQFLDRFKRLNEHNHNPSLSKLDHHHLNTTVSRSNSPQHKKHLNDPKIKHHGSPLNKSSVTGLHNTNLGQSHSKVTFSQEHSKNMVKQRHSKVTLQQKQQKGQVNDTSVTLDLKQVDSLESFTLNQTHQSQGKDLGSVTCPDKGNLNHKGERSKNTSNLRNQRYLSSEEQKMIGGLQKIYNSLQNKLGRQYQMASDIDNLEEQNKKIIKLRNAKINVGALTRAVKQRDYSKLSDNLVEIDQIVGEAAEIQNLSEELKAMKKNAVKKVELLATKSKQQKNFDILNNKTAKKSKDVGGASSQNRSRNASVDRSHNNTNIMTQTSYQCKLPEVKQNKIEFKRNLCSGTQNIDQSNLNETSMHLQSSNQSRLNYSQVHNEFSTSFNGNESSRMPYGKKSRNQKLRSQNITHDNITFRQNSQNQSKFALQQQQQQSNQNGYNRPRVHRKNLSQNLNHKNINQESAEVSQDHFLNMPMLPQESKQQRVQRIYEVKSTHNGMLTSYNKQSNQTQNKFDFSVKGTNSTQMSGQNIQTNSIGVYTTQNKKNLAKINLHHNQYLQQNNSGHSQVQQQSNKAKMKIVELSNTQSSLQQKTWYAKKVKPFDQTQKYNNNQDEHQLTQSSIEMSSEMQMGGSQSRQPVTESKRVSGVNNQDKQLNSVRKQMIFSPKVQQPQEITLNHLRKSNLSPSKTGHVKSIYEHQVVAPIKKTRPMLAMSNQFINQQNDSTSLSGQYSVQQNSNNMPVVNSPLTRRVANFKQEPLIIDSQQKYTKNQNALNINENGSTFYSNNQIRQGNQTTTNQQVNNSQHLVNQSQQSSQNMKFQNKNSNNVSNFEIDEQEQRKNISKQYHANLLKPSFITSQKIYKPLKVSHTSRIKKIRRESLNDIQNSIDEQQFPIDVIDTTQQQKQRYKEINASQQTFHETSSVEQHDINPQGD